MVRKPGEDIPDMQIHTTQVIQLHTIQDYTTAILNRGAVSPEIEKAHERIKTCEHDIAELDSMLKAPRDVRAAEFKAKNSGQDYYFRQNAATNSQADSLGVYAGTMLIAGGGSLAAAQFFQLMPMDTAVGIGALSVFVLGPALSYVFQKLFSRKIYEHRVDRDVRRYLTQERAVRESLLAQEKENEQKLVTQYIEKIKTEHPELLNPLNGNSEGNSITDDEQYIIVDGIKLGKNGN